MSQKKTRKFKETVCGKCAKANKSVMETGGDYCKDKSAKIKDGQCSGFGVTKPKPKKVKQNERS